MFMKFRSNPTQLLPTLFLFITIAVFSCKKETSGTSSEDEALANISATESNAEAEDVFNGVFDDVLGVNANVGWVVRAVLAEEVALITEQATRMAGLTTPTCYPPVSTYSLYNRLP